MTYNVFGGTLNLAQSINLVGHQCSYGPDTTVFAYEKLTSIELSRFSLNIVVVVKELNLVRRGRLLNRFWHEAKWLPDRKSPLTDF